MSIMDPKNYEVFKNSAFPEINRPISSKQKNVEDKKKKKPYSGIGRDAKIDPDLYYHIKEENEQLKKTKIALNQKITKLETSLLNIKENILKERRQADYKYVNPEKNYEIDFIKSKQENEKLKLENEKKDLIIKGLQNDYSQKDKKSKKRKIDKNVKEFTEQKVKNDYLALIQRLREQLKYMKEDRDNLMSEIRNIKDAYANVNQNMNNNDYMNNIGYKNKFNQEMASKMVDLNTNYESAQMKLDTQNKILEMTKRSLEEYMNKYERERENNRKLQADLAILKGQSDQIENYKRQLEDYKINQIKLEDELNDLRINPFIKQAEERGNVYSKLQKCQRNLTETKKELDEKDKKLTEAELRLDSLEKENKELQDKLNLEKLDKDKYKEESLKLKIKRIEQEKNDKLFQDKLNKFSENGEIESNLTNLLSMYKRRNDELNWANINFIEPDLIKNNDPQLLIKEIDRLKVEKNTLGKELEYTKNALLIQQQINTEYKKERDFENEKNKNEIKLLKNKIEELCKLIDIQNMSKDINNNTISDPNLTQTLKYPKTMPLSNKPNLLEDKLTEESQEETEIELTINENALDIYFGECVYEDNLEAQIGYDLDDLLSFFSVDFYMHETQTSDILNGKNPMFNFQILFKVDVNEAFLNYLKNEYMTIEVYSLRDNVQIILGEGKISLNELLNNNPNLSRQKINGVCEIFYKKNKRLKIATLHYQMKMIKPLSEALKWYYEQSQKNEEDNKMKESIQLKSGLSLKDYANIGKKAYEIKILVTKANDLSVEGPPRRISPYFYYKFYKNGVRYSKNCEGNNPKFEDSASFNEIITQEFLDYIQKENLNIYIFDSMNPIELNVSDPQEVSMIYTNQQASKDIIGTCKIPLRGLLANDLVQGEFPIFNLKNEKVGSLVINIIWEEINIGNETNLVKYDDISEDQLIIKLAEALKQKGLNIESAFNIFDIDGMNEISIDNFKNTLIFTLKFTTNQSEVEYLVKILFKDKGKLKLDKNDFYKIFSKLLASEGQIYGSNINIINEVNNSIKISENNNKENPKENTQIIPQKEKEKEIKSSQENERRTSLINQTSNNNTSINNLTNEEKKDRSIIELGQLIYKYKMSKKRNFDAVDLFKDIFDKDASLGIDKRELHKGCEKMGIILSQGETDKLWKKISGNKGIIDFSSFKAFYDKYCKEEVKEDSSEKGNNGENMTGTQQSGPFLTNKPPE